MEVKECEGLKMLKKQLLLFPGLNGLMPWHSYAKVNPTKVNKDFRIHPHLQSLKLSKFTH